MLGEKLGQIQGPIKTTVLPANGSHPRFANAYEGSGTISGVAANCLATYSNELQTNGSIYGECPNQGVIMTQTGEIATFRTTGIGRFTSEGGVILEELFIFRRLLRLWNA